MNAISYMENAHDTFKSTHVIAPELFMDTLTHLFIEWDDLKHNGFKAGCINLLCPGFVQVDRSFYPGMAFHHVSVVNGEQMELRSMIRQDNQTGNWWLHNLDSTPAPVGAQYPPMGSGQLPNGDYSHSAYYRELQFVNSAGYLEDIRYKTTTVITTNLACFGFENKGWDGEDMRYAIQYGGPGGDCPAKSY
ncbi:Neprosin [Dillenia turbinata]|uniref:Neprosin n=1 Tax=Dillenia turbinata TaxID=194707 RepID=A0AAN8UJQ3_9MAGN